MRRWVAAIVFAMTPLATASAGWWDDLDKGEPVRLSDLTAQADRWKGKVVTFACIYHKFDSVFQPYFTSFNPEKWLNATAWYDGAPIWEMETFRDQDFPFLYLEQSHPQRDEMIAMQPYTRIEITGRVKDVYRQHPFIEILGFHATPATFGKNIVEWMVRGDGAAAVGDYARAEANYRLVLAQVTLDETTRLRAQKRLDEALRAAGHPAGAAEEKAGPVFGGSTMPKPRRGAAPAVGAGETAGSPAAGGGGPAAAGGDPFARGREVRVAPLPGGNAPTGGAPSALTTEDLPGTPVDSHPGRAAPVLPGPGLPEADPALPPRPPAPPPAAGAPPATVPACPPAPVAEPPAGPDATPPACPPGDAVPPPPPAGAPPPRSPRLSGVR